MLWHGPLLSPLLRGIVVGATARTDALREAGTLQEPAPSESLCIRRDLSDGLLRKRGARLAYAPAEVRRHEYCKSSTRSGGHGVASLSVDALVESPLIAATWLILPVVICLSQRLSHACLSIYSLYCETANGSLNQLEFI